MQTPSFAAPIVDLRNKATIDLGNLADVYHRVSANARKQVEQFPDLTNATTYQQHATLVVEIANSIVLAPQRRSLVIDQYNRNAFKFLLYYFNDCPLAEEVFPDRHLKLHKPIMLRGDVGTGKTLLMQIFSEYLRYTNNPNYFVNLSVTQMVNYYTVTKNIDKYTFNEENSNGFKAEPLNVCLNDIGIPSKLYYGQDLKTLTEEFLHARNDIWTLYGKRGHITTNLSVDELRKAYDDGRCRLPDRFKSYNVINLGGKSRR